MPFLNKKILVCLPTTEAQRTALQAAAPEADFRFTTESTVTAADAVWAEIVLGNVPVEMIAQNDRIEWFQSNAAGPNDYLKPGVLPEHCIVTNATGAYGLSISEWMLGSGWVCRKISSSTATARTPTSGLLPDTRCGVFMVRGCSASGWATLAPTLPAVPTRWGLRWWASAAASIWIPPARIIACGWWHRPISTRNCPRRTAWH